MNPNNRLYAAVCCLAVVGTVIGCGGDQVKGIDRNLIPVTGKVTYDGKPLKAGDISFISTDNPGKGYASTIDASGNYSLAYSQSSKGALPGNYNVRIASTEGVGSMGEKGEVIPPKSVIPDKYNDPSASGLKATVEKGKSNVFNFDLKPE